VSKLGTLPILGQPDPNQPADVHLVGRYAVGVTWADRHGSIYPFAHLRHACPCGAPADRDPTEAGAWPRGIARSAEGLRVEWSDGHVSLYPYAALRAQCRCAGCAGGH
jgi:DUF971 family protein